LLQEKILLGQRVTELFDTALEIRRYERNFFLHGEVSDWSENRSMTAQMLRLIDADRSDFELLRAGERGDSMRHQLMTYASLMDQYQGRTASDRETLELDIRAVGHEIATTAEQLVDAERRQVGSSLETFRTLLFSALGAVAVATVAIGQALSRLVVRPLKEIERGVAALAGGSRRKLAVRSRDREALAIVEAFNHMLDELDTRQQHLLRSEKLASMGTMVAGVAHELNNPISNIWSTSQLLLEDPAFPGTYREKLRQIDEQSIRSRNIVRSLLDFTRERGFARETVLLGDLVQQTLRFLKGSIPPEVAVHVEIAEGLQVRADRQRLQQALLNLIRNAVDAVGSTGHIDIAAKLHEREDAQPEDPALSGFQDRPFVEIRVADDGPGIEPSVLPRIFDPFFTTKNVGDGMGLGLFIVYGIVEEHDGAISARSRPGEGTTIVVRLPVEEED
ncbi:MAG TPA: HAMP domain-containing sensor histidine kinase, partial [Rhodocyclaceae bacterium]|nr:HAMP domain-containing sensor histidine kinase [Rhodocyclaceae bacterium]